MKEYKVKWNTTNCDGLVVYHIGYLHDFIVKDNRVYAIVKYNSNFRLVDMYDLVIVEE